MGALAGGYLQGDLGKSLSAAVVGVNLIYYEELPEDHLAWEIEAEYLSQMCVNTIVMLSPKRIVLGGGVMHQMHLFPRIRRRTLALLNGYVAHPAILEDMDHYIVPPALGDNAGAAGSLLLALEALKAKL